MAPITKSAYEDEEQQQQQAPACHPLAPPDELFEISTTVDPSYIISLIRKLLPIDGEVRRNGQLKSDDGSEVLNVGVDAMDTENNRFAKSEFPEEGAELRSGVSVGEEGWEEYGCVLWDLAASKTHAELMVENLVLDVLLANLMVPQPERVTEIILGIIGNLGCHEVIMKRIVGTNGLLLFLCRLLTLSLQGSEGNTWAEALQHEEILKRIIWVTENTLNPQLLEKSVGLILAVLESELEAVSTLLSSLMNLGLPMLLVSLFAFEMSKLTGEKSSERYSALDIILRAIESLSVADGYSHEISSNKQLFELVCGLVKLDDKAEIASSCVTAGVLIANILSDAAHLPSLKQTDTLSNPDLPFLQGLLDIFPFASDDYEARTALWSIMTRVLNKVEEDKLSPSSLHELVSVFVSRADLIEDDLLDFKLKDSNDGPSEHPAKSNARTLALKRIISILNKWASLKDCVAEDNLGDDCHTSSAGVQRLLGCCIKYSGSLKWYHEALHLHYLYDDIDKRVLVRCLTLFDKVS
ncbi:hypothetical protein ACFE04_015918 [Oxalis oulophora]